MKRIFPLLLASCTVIRPITASNADLVDARSVRLARAEGDRLARMSTYLEHHPKGEWASDFRAAFDAEEPAFYRASTKSRGAAIDYIAWLPHGPHAQAAFALVRSFDEHEPEDEQGRLLKAAQEDEKRLERLAQERTYANKGAVEAARVVLDPAIYGRKLEESNDLVRFFSSGMNIGRTPTKRTRVLPYTIPAKNGPIARTLELTVSLAFDRGVITSAVIDGPDLFQRWAEAALTREVSPDEAERYVRDAVTTLAHGAVSVEVANNLVTVAKK
jgi:hypothetical protein